MTTNETDIEYELPSILLAFKDKKYSLFSPSPLCETLFGSDYVPETIDIPLNDGDQYNTVLFDSPLFYLILELKNLLSVENDISLEIPQLRLTLHQVCFG